MFITTLHANNFRNLTNLELTCNQHFNLFYGLNGAGKSNILEAIYFLGTGKAFRTHLLKKVLQYNQDNLQLYAKINAGDERYTTVGVQRNLNGDNQLRLAGNAVKSHSEIARFLPMQLISQASYDLLTAGTGMRRRFLDWGVFHVEPSFYNYWQKLQRTVQQRNTAIRNKAPTEQITLWDKELVTLSLLITKLRTSYFEQLLPIIEELLQSFLPETSFKTSFYPGWPKDTELSQILVEHLPQDLRFGYTCYGAHRADIVIRNRQNQAINAADTLSRGQQKLLVLALKLGQGRLYNELSARHCLFLIDDLPAELDAGKKSLVFNMLQKLAAQTFITSVDAEHFQFLASIAGKNNLTLFHVEQGAV